MTDNRLSAPAADRVFIATIVFLSLVRYTPHLGFYSDDWAFLGLYATTADQTVRGLYEASYSSQHAMRPVQLWLCAVLYRMFGLEPAAYHWVNAVLVIANPLLVHAIARAVGVSRIIAVSVALVYGLLPGYSTDRFWYVAIAITLSMTAGLLSLYADLKAVTARVAAAAAWKAIAVVALAVSGLTYEVALPMLLVAAPVLVGWQLRRHAVPRERTIALVALFAINVALLGGLAAFKMRTTVRLGAKQGTIAQVGAIARHAFRTDVPRGAYGLNVANAVRVHFLEYGVQLLPNAVTLARTAPFAVRALTLLAAILIAAYFASALARQPWPPRRTWVALGVAGLVVFALGYAIFLTNYNVQFTTTGIANRTAIAAVLGAAMCLVAVAGALASLVPGSRARVIIFAAAVTLISSSGFLIVNAVAQQWMIAYAAERNILNAIGRRFPTLPPGSTLLLEGVCPYVGPAIVFEADWDLTGALQVHYRTRALSATAVTPRMTADEDAITATTYEQPTRYPYAPSLFAYHAGTGIVRPLADASSARAWLSQSHAGTSCPEGHEGIGIEPF